MNAVTRRTDIPDFADEAAEARYLEVSGATVGPFTFKKIHHRLK